MIRPRCTAGWLAAIVLASTWLAPAGASADETAAEQAYRVDIEQLAGDAMAGRGLGGEGIERAAQWIERRLGELQLQPAFGDSYRQPFPVKVGVGMQGENQIEGLAGDDWVPLGFSSSGSFDGGLVFAGSIHRIGIHHNDRVQSRRLVKSGDPVQIVLRHIRR